MNNDNQKPELNTDPLPQTESQSPEQSGPAIPPQTNKPKWYKNKKLLVLALLLVIVGGSALAWVLTKDKNAVSQTPPAAVTQTTQEKEQKPLAPFAIAYSNETEDQSKTQDCQTSQTQLYWRPIAGGDQTSAAGIGQNNVISDYGVHKNKVFIAEAPGCGSKDGPGIWFSSDSGKTYAKIYSGKPAANNDSFTDQITSAQFSSDGKTILIANLPGDGSKNTVKEIDPETKSVKDLFSVEKRGVLLEGYDTNAKQILYYSGCYDCDGNSFNKLLVHDLAKATDAVLFDDTKQIGEQTVPNDDFSKILLVKSTPGDYLGGGQPYNIEEFDVATKTSKNLLTINEDGTVIVGYRDGDGTRWYSKGNGIYSLGPDGTTTTLFEATKPILSVHYVGKDQIVADSGEYNNYSVTSYTISTKSAVKLLDGDDHTHVFGVTWK